MSSTLVTTSSTLIQPVFPRTARSTRLAAVDVARYLSVLAVVWLHAARSPVGQATTTWTRFGVPFFVAASVYFVLRHACSHSSQPTWTFARDRFVRLYLPFLAWSGIYLMLKGVKWWLLPDQANELPGWELLVTGGVYHLWFVPFLWVISIGAYAAGRIVAAHHVGHRCASGCAMVAGVAIGFAAVPPLPTNWPEALVFMWQALPGACWGAAIYWLGQTMRWPRSAAWTTTLGTLLFGQSMVLLYVLGRDPLLENLAGCGLLVIGLSAQPGPLVRLLARFGPIAFGVYFSHLVFVKIVESVAQRCAWPSSWMLDLATFGLSAVLSTTLSWQLARYRSTRWLVA